MEAALAADRYPGFSAWDLDQEALSIVGFAGNSAGAALAVEGGLVCGYVNPRHDDLTVHPAHRRRGLGRRLLSAGLELAAADGEELLTLFVPLVGPGRAFAEAMGMAYRSSLWRMDLPAGVPVPEPSFPAAVVSRNFGDWLPIERYVALLNAAFADHPTPLRWTPDVIALAHARPDFDPGGVLLLCPAESPGEPIGFARTLMGPPEEGGGGSVGEIRAIGVLAEWRGHGLGRELLRWGVAHLRGRGAATVKLSVEARNELALGLYRRNGFEATVEWPNWTLPVGARVPGLAE
jgi:mycothiol synthase